MPLMGYSRVTAPVPALLPRRCYPFEGQCVAVHSFSRPASQSSRWRSVRPGVVEGDTTEIIAGVIPGEVIAAKNSMVLEAQLLKSNLGAGCSCCSGGPKEKKD